MDKAKQRMQARRAKAKAATDALDEDEDDEEDAAAEEKAEDSEDEKVCFLVGRRRFIAFSPLSLGVGIIGAVSFFSFLLFLL